MNFPHDFYRYENGTLTCEGIPLKEIVHKIGTPVYVYSGGALLSNLQALQKGLKGLNHTICFAMKSNSNLAVIRLLSQAGAGMDVVSGGELFRAQHAMVPHNQIVFSGVGKTIQEMKEGLSYQNKGIFSFNIESIPELLTLNRVAGEMNVKASVALRFNPDVDPKTHPYISTGLKTHKFGMDKNEILKIISQLKDLPHIHLKGISIHIGSQILSLSPFKDAFTRLIDLIDEIHQPLEFVNLGGGLGITYQNEKPVSTHEYCQLIQDMFGKKSKLKGKLKIVLEPGRQISGNAGVLIAQILYRKVRRSQDFLIVNAAMTDLIRPALYESYHEICPLEEKFVHGKSKKTMVVGPVCESADFLGKNRNLSVDLQTGDLLAVLSAGAYGFTMASHYNSRPLIAEVLVHDGRFHVVRERENYLNLVAQEHAIENCG